ncbi:hypothetical protein [Virgibacillus oceani]
MRDAGCFFAEEETRILNAAARNLEDLKRKVELRAGGLPLE